MILGVFLYKITIDSFKASKDVIKYRSIGGNNNSAYPPHDSALDVPVDRPYNRPGFRAWLEVPLEVIKYVDDNLILEKLCLDGRAIDADGKKIAQAVRTQNLFRQITRIAHLKGMKVNSLKTMLLCISDS